MSSGFVDPIGRGKGGEGQRGGMANAAVAAPPPFILYQPFPTSVLKIIWSERLDWIHSKSGPIHLEGTVLWAFYVIEPAFHILRKVGEELREGKGWVSPLIFPFGERNFKKERKILYLVSKIQIPRLKINIPNKMRS